MTSVPQCQARLRRLVWLAAVVLLALASGCAPKIGDKCTLSTDCSVSGDRLCDSTQPGGYCTVFNCEPNACPDDSVCVGFNEPTCSSPAESVRFERTFCMATCKSNSDCRGPDYQCLDISHDPVRQVLDSNPSTQLICSVAPAPLPEGGTSDAAPAVCNPFDGSLPESAASQSDAGDASNAESSTDALSPDATDEAIPDVVIDSTADAGIDAPAE